MSIDERKQSILDAETIIRDLRKKHPDNAINALDALFRASGYMAAMTGVPLAAMMLGVTEFYREADQVMDKVGICPKAKESKEPEAKASSNEFSVGEIGKWIASQLGLSQKT